MRALRIVMAVLVMASAAQAKAQAVNLQFQSGPPVPGVMAWGYYIGPFTGTVLSDPTLPTISIYCVDILNTINWGQNWAANITNLGSPSISNTRYGTTAIDNYRKAAWLTNQFTTSPGPASWAGIQTAIWNLLKPGVPIGGSTGTYWLNAANSFAASSAWSTYDWSQYTVITPVQAAGQVYSVPQEFISSAPYLAQLTTPTNTVSPTVAPEPETWLLLGTGLIGIVGFAAVRGLRV